MFTQSPPFQPQYIPEQDNIASKHVEIIPINAPNIILIFFKLAEFVVLINIQKGTRTYCSVKRECPMRRMIAITCN
jgi:hypothetical protein